MRTITLDLDDNLGNPILTTAVAKGFGQMIPWVVTGALGIGTVFLVRGGINKLKRDSEDKNALDPNDSAYIAAGLKEALEYKDPVAGWDWGWEREKFFRFFETIASMKELDQVLKSFKKLNNGKDLYQQLESEAYFYDSDWQRLRLHSTKLSSK